MNQLMNRNEPRIIGDEVHGWGGVDLVLKANGIDRESVHVLDEGWVQVACNHHSESSEALGPWCPQCDRFDCFSFIRYEDAVNADKDGWKHYPVERINQEGIDELKKELQA